MAICKLLYNPLQPSFSFHGFFDLIDALSAVIDASFDFPWKHIKKREIQEQIQLTLLFSSKGFKRL